MIRAFGVTAAIGLWTLAACAPTEPVRSLALLDGEIMATTPDGYCVDRRASRPGDGFAVMAPCATLGANDASPGAIGVATVQIGPPESGAVAGSETALRDLLESEAGAALLSASGEAEAITILNSQALDNTVTVHFTDAGAAPIAGLQGEEWRAFKDINGRLVTVAVRGLVTAPLQDGTGAWLLDLVVNGLLAVGNDVPPSDAEA